MVGKRRHVGGGFGSKHLCVHGLLEGSKLIIGKDEQKRFENNDSFSQTGVQIIMSGINSLPIGGGFGRDAAAEILRCASKIAAEGLHHFFQRTDLMKEMRASGKKQLSEQVTHPGRSDSSASLEVARVKRRGIRDRAVVPCVLPNRP